ncbi:hypothetical protein D3C87_2065940 [compost metagenome]
MLLTLLILFGYNSYSFQLLPFPQFKYDRPGARLLKAERLLHSFIAQKRHDEFQVTDRQIRQTVVPVFVGIGPNC